MKWQAVFFDFDGVILDSVHAKTEAFAQMFRPFGTDIEQAVVTYHLAHGGISRFEKFRHYYTHFLNIPVSEDRLQELGEEFSELVLTKILQSPFIAGAEATLVMLNVEKIPAYVVSGTPSGELEFIVERRGLTKFFREVHGSPRFKEEILLDVIGRNGFEPARCIFLGDAMSDYKAAHIVGLKFLGIVSEQTPFPFPPGTPVSSVVQCNFEDF